MSIDVMKRVWDHSDQKGGSLLLMIALADNANADGECWPGIAHLAQKTRLSERQVQRLIQELDQVGELAVEWGAGRSRTHLIYVLPGLSDEKKKQIRAEVTARNKAREAARAAESAKKGDKMSPPAPIENGDISERNGDISNTKGDIFELNGDIFSVKGDIAMSPEPINRINQQEPLEPDSPSAPTETKPAERPPEAIWNLIAGQLQLEMTRSHFETWVKPLICRGWTENRLIISAANQYGCEWVRDHIGSRANRMVGAFAPSRAGAIVEFVVAS